MREPKPEAYGPPLEVAIHRLRGSDPRVLGDAFDAIGWNKPIARFEQYFRDQQDGRREVLVAWVGDVFVGYVTLCWESGYEPMRKLGTPEIQDLNVLPAYRRRGIGTRLLDEAERIASEKHARVGIGVGLHPGYNAAQRLYVRRGYVPDGRGVTCRNEFVPEGSRVALDDDLVLHLTKVISTTGRLTSESSLGIRPLEDGEAGSCEQLLRSLPEWFGIERAIVEYRQAIEVLETFVALVDGDLAGFLTLNRPSAAAPEIHVMAVSRSVQGRGIGSALLEHVEERLRAQAVEYLQVKTLGPSRPDANYERTRRFYMGRGFRPIEETDLLGKRQSVPASREAPVLSGLETLTPDPPVRGVLASLADAIVEALDSNLVGLYLFGSLTYGDFVPGRSDIDLQAIVRESLSPAELLLVEQAHKGIEQASPAWERRVECAYLPQRLLREVLPPKEPRPWFGFGVLYAEAPHGSEWLINKYLLWRDGVALVGPAFGTLVDPVDANEVRKASARDLFQEWMPKVDEPEWLADSHQQSYLVLNLCRILSAVVGGSIASKSAAAAWTRARYPQWSELIEVAERWRYGIEMGLQSDVIAFLRFAGAAVTETGILIELPEA